MYWIYGWFGDNCYFDSIKSYSGLCLGFIAFSYSYCTLMRFFFFFWWLFSNSYCYCEWNFFSYHTFFLHVDLASWVLIVFQLIFLNFLGSWSHYLQVETAMSLHFCFVSTPPGKNNRNLIQTNLTKRNLWAHLRSQYGWTQGIKQYH